jgi:hypothetical protein
VKSAYYGGVKTGVVFTVILLPKQQGSGIISLDNIVINAFDERATPLITTSKYVSITVPDLISNATLPGKVVKEVSPASLSVFLERSDLLHNGAWYVTVYDSQPKSAIETISIIESDSPTALSREDVRWKKITTPHILFHQDRSKFIHILVTYSNGAYAFKKVAPVENSQVSVTISRILSSVLILAFLYVIFVYVTHHVRFFSKKNSKTSP